MLVPYSGEGGIAAARGWGGGAADNLGTSIIYG